MKKIILGIAFAILATVPVTAEDKPKEKPRAERTVRTQTPYSNEQVRQRRALRETVREIERERRGPYRFERARRSRPEN